MTMDDPGWEGGPTPPKPKVSKGVDRTMLLRIGGGVLALVVVVAVVALAGHKKSGSSNSSSTSGHSTSSSSSSSSSTSSSASSSSTIPVLGVTVSAEAKPITSSSGKQVSITDKNGQSVPISGVTVVAVRPMVTTASNASKATPAAVIGLANGDVIWAISQVSDTNFTEVTGGSVISTFLRNYADTGSTSQIYVYYYEPASGTNHLQPAEVSLLQAPGSLTTIDCTVAPGC